MGSDPINGWIGLILFILITPAFYAYVQSGLNPVWERLAGPAEKEAAPAEEVGSDRPDVEPS